jgi:hypothetical protein
MTILPDATECRLALVLGIVSVTLASVPGALAAACAPTFGESRRFRPRHGLQSSERLRKTKQPLAKTPRGKDSQGLTRFCGFYDLAPLRKTHFVVQQIFHRSGRFGASGKAPQRPGARQVPSRIQPGVSVLFWQPQGEFVFLPKFALACRNQQQPAAETAFDAENQGSVGLPVARFKLDLLTRVR